MQLPLLVLLLILEIKGFIHKIDSPQLVELVGAICLFASFVTIMSATHYYQKKICLVILHTLHTLSNYLIDNQRSMLVYAVFLLVYAKVLSKRKKTLGFAFVPRGGTICPRPWDICSQALGQILVFNAFSRKALEALECKYSRE